MTKTGSPVLGHFSGSGQDPHERALKRVSSGKHGLFEVKNIKDYKKLHKPKYTK